MFPENKKVTGLVSTVGVIINSAGRGRLPICIPSQKLPSPAVATYRHSLQGERWRFQNPHLVEKATCRLQHIQREHLRFYL